MSLNEIEAKTVKVTSFADYSDYLSDIKFSFQKHIQVENDCNEDLKK